MDVRRSCPSTPTTAHEVALGYATGSPLAVELERRGVPRERRVARLDASFVETMGSPSFDLPLPGLLTTARRG